MIYTSLGVLISKSLLINNKLDIADPVKNIFFWFWLARVKKKKENKTMKKKRKIFYF
jgi:hypothetical protein